MDHSPPPVLYALAACHRQGEVPFAPPGYQQDRGADPRVLPVLEKGVFRSDVLVAGGLDGRRSSAGLVQWAEQPMADAIGAEQNVLLDVRQFPSAKATTLAVAGPDAADTPAAFVS